MSEVNIPATEAYFDGTADIYYAQMQTADAPQAAPTYEDFQLMGMSVDIKVTPKYKEGTRYASNRKVRNKRVLDGYEMEFSLDKVRAAIRSKIEGRQKDDNGVELLGASDPLPAAVAFGLTLDDGTMEMWQLYRGVFESVEVEGKTAEDKFEYQDHKVKAVFDRRLSDGRLGAVVESGDKAVAEDVIKNWFTKVYEPTFTTEGGGGETA